MRLAKSFIKLPWNFDHARLAEEVGSIEPAAWMEHPSRMNGNSAAALISRNGLDNDDFDGVMKLTPHLKKCAYLQQVLASFDQVLGRSRLMKLAPGCEVATHVDFNYHWYSRVRIHVPIITSDAVTFICGTDSVNMPAGSSWIFDSWRRHRVTNEGSEDRVHLVVDTAGSSRFWQTVRQAEQMDATELQVDFDPAAHPQIRTERYNIAAVMAPGEMRELADDLIDDFSACPENDPQLVQHYRELLQDLCADWREVWAQFGSEDAGLPHYRLLLRRTKEGMNPDRRALLTSSNKIGVNPVIVQRILRAALAPDL